MIIFITRFATSLPSYNLIPLFNLLGNTICGWCCGHTIHVTAARSQYLHLECYGPAALCVTCAYWKLILAGQLISGLHQQQHNNTKIKIFQGCQKYLRVCHRWHLRRWGRCSRGRSWCWRGCRGCWARLRLCPAAARRRSAAPPGHHNYYLLFLLSIIYCLYYLSTCPPASCDTETSGGRWRCSVSRSSADQSEWVLRSRDQSPPITAHLTTPSSGRARWAAGWRRTPLPGKY